MPSYGHSLPAPSLHQALVPALHTYPGGSGLSPPRCVGLRRKFLPQVVSLCGVRKGTFWPLNCGQRILLAPGALDSNADSITRGTAKKRDIVEHIFLLKAKSDISEDEEKNMLDYLYTSQYQMRGIVAISLECGFLTAGRIADLNVDGFTHAVYMRFQKKEDLVKFYSNSYYAGVLKEHVMPYCHDSMSVDFESEVEDDILPIFRRGEEFNYGIEFVLLISISKNAINDAVEDALTTLSALIDEFDPLITQATQGSNFNHIYGDYTHAAVIRFPSLEALEIFRGCSQYKDMWRSKFQPIIKKALAVYFTVDPVGTELM